MTIELYLAYVLACIVVVAVPGPNVTVIIANSLRFGRAAGLWNVAGTQAGLAILLIILAAGLQIVIENLAYVFDWIKLIGAAYLIWLGLKLLRSDGNLGLGDAAHKPNGSGSYFWQGCLVLLSNPKALLFFGAFIPQFIDPAGDPVVQTLFLGATFMAVATVLDSGYALAAGTAGSLLSKPRVRVLEKVSGVCLIGGGLWLALSRRA